MENMSLKFNQNQFEQDYKRLFKCDTLPLDGEKTSDALVYVVPITQTYFEFWLAGKESVKRG